MRRFRRVLDCRVRGVGATWLTLPVLRLEAAHQVAHLEAQMPSFCPLPAEKVTKQTSCHVVFIGTIGRRPEIEISSAGGPHSTVTPLPDAGAHPNASSMPSEDRRGTRRRHGGGSSATSCNIEPVAFTPCGSTTRCCRSQAHCPWALGVVRTEVGRLPTDRLDRRRS